MALGDFTYQLEVIEWFVSFIPYTVNCYYLNLVKDYLHGTPDFHFSCVLKRASRSWNAISQPN